jgi:dipeptidyl aminopeptidase/acylaminoacyl peptidase
LVYSVEDEATGEDRWFEMPLAGGDAAEILKDEQVGGNYIDPRNRQLIGYVRDGDVPEAHFYDARQEKVMAATRRAFPGVNVRLVDWSDRFDHLIVRTDGIGDPLTWWKVDIATGQANPLGVSYPMVAADVGPMRMVRYKAADGLDVSGVLTLPPGRPAKNLPVVLFPHGGPSARDYPGFDWWAQAFAAQGYAVFQPNFRGSTGYGAAFQHAGNGEWGRKMQTDISDGLAELVRQGIVDPKRACIMGASYGGYAALAGVTLQQGLYRCAVAVAGVSDVQQMYQTDVAESGSDPALIRGLKAEIGSGRALKDVSPIRFAERADAPILLIHGKDDTVVQYAQSSAMARALRQAGKPVEFVTLPGEDHWLSKSATRLAMLQAALTFVERNNPPDPAP